MSWITREYTNSLSLLDQIIITFFLITALASSIVFDMTKEIVLIFITLLFFSFQERLLRKWLTALVNTIPLFISLLIYDILFNNGYFNTIRRQLIQIKELTDNYIIDWPVYWIIKA